ncbi:hypothetical protein D3C76_1823620 [compost metagenome]
MVDGHSRLITWVSCPAPLNMWRQGSRFASQMAASSLFMAGFIRAGGMFIHSSTSTVSPRPPAIAAKACRSS